MALRCVHEPDGCYWCIKRSLHLIDPYTRTRTAGGGIVEMAQAYIGEPDERQRMLVGVIDPVEPEPQRSWLGTWELANLAPQAWERTDAESWVPSWETVRR